MAKARTVFFCNHCGNETPKWQGRCPACGAWNTIEEHTEKPTPGRAKAAPVGMSRRPQKLSEVDSDNEIRFTTGMAELDRVLGGGAVLGSLVLVGGAPGIGKSTLLLQICKSLCQGHRVLYVSGEESERQLKLRSEQQASINISIPRATYITYAFTEFFKKIQNLEEIQINFSETNSEEAVENILYHGFHLGVIRFPEIMEDNTLRMLQQKKLRYRPIWTFDYMLLTSRQSALAALDEVHPENLKGYTELVHGDVNSAFLPEPAGGGDEGKRIYLYERGSQFDFLSNVPTTYMWVSPLPEKVLRQHELVQIPCPDNRYRYRDILIYHEDYPFTGYEEQFYNILLQTRDEIEKSSNLSGRLG